MLHFAASEATPEHQAILETLIQRGADASITENTRKATPLMWASLSRIPEAVAKLIPVSDLHVFDARGRTALGCCSNYNGSAPCADLLLRHGADLHLQAKADQPCAFELAVLEGSSAILAMIPYVNFGLKSTDGSTWMELAQKTERYISADNLQATLKDLHPGDLAAKERQALYEAIVSKTSAGTMPARKNTL